LSGVLWLILTEMLVGVLGFGEYGIKLWTAALGSTDDF